MAMEPLNRSVFLKLSALGGAGIALLGGPELTLAALARTDDDLDAVALDGDAASAHVAARILAVARGTSAGANTRKAIAAIGGLRAFVSSGDVVVIKPNIGHARAPRYAADTYATRLFGKKPGAVPYIAPAAKMRLGAMDLSALTVRLV